MSDRSERTVGRLALSSRLLCLGLLLSSPVWSVACASPDPSPSTDSVAMTLDAADLALARGRMYDAEDGYLSVLEARPGEPRALAGLARVALAEGEIESALDWDDRARSAAGAVQGGFAPRERCALWQAAAEQRIASGSPTASAADELVARLEADPVCSSSVARALRARILLLEARIAHDAGDTDAALAACREALAADPTVTEVDRLAGRWLLDSGRRREALAWLGDALARHPDDDGLRLLMLEALGVPIGDDEAAHGREGRAPRVP